MEIVSLGNTGLKVSRLCIGTMTFGSQCDEKTAHMILDFAYDAGIFFIDVADVYPTPVSLDTVGLSEKILGKWLKSKPRDSLVVASKCGNISGAYANSSGLSRKHIIEACKASLKRLNLDYIELYQVHRPDNQTPIEETLEALAWLKQQGLVLYMGVSNFEVWRLADAFITAAKMGLNTLLSTVQPRYNLLHREPERELLPFCKTYGLGVITYNPLAGGLLTGKYQNPHEIPEEGRFAKGSSYGDLYRSRYWNEKAFEVVERLKSVASEVGCTLAQLAIAWILSNKTICCPILGATKPEHISENVKGAEIVLDREVLSRIDQITQEFR
jgi:aryl-alcohol dehydrogenase-like predicted oxidoreductase